MQLQRVFPLFPNWHKKAGRNKQTNLSAKTKILCLSTPVFCFISTATLIVLALLNHSMKITEQLKLEGTSGGCLPQPPCSKHVNDSKLLRVVSSWVLSYCQGWRIHNIFWTTCFSDLSPLPQKNPPFFSSCLNGISCIKICAHYFMLSVETTESSLALSSLFHPIRLFTHIGCSRALSSPG